MSRLFLSVSLLVFAACSAAESPLTMSFQTLPDVKINKEFVGPFRDERNIDIQSNNKQLEDENIKFVSAIKRKHADQRIKHPFIITKDDIESLDQVVDDNIIVESNVLRLVRPVKRTHSNFLRVKREDTSDSLVPHKRVARGWNLQHVIVPNSPPYSAYPGVLSPIPDSKKWDRVAKRSKIYWDQPPKYQGWGANAQNLGYWSHKYYG